MEANAITNLSEVTADFVRLFQPSSRTHQDVRDLFVHQADVISPAIVEIPVGDETETILEYTNPTNEQIPALQGLLQYIDQQYPPQPINRYHTTNRRHLHRSDGDTHTTVVKRTIQKRDVRILLDVYAPVIYSKRVQVNKTIRPIYIFPYGSLD